MVPAKRLALFTREGLLALASIGLSVALLALGELLAREIAPSWSHPHGLMELHQYSEVYGWTSRPGATLLDGGQLATINAAGYRGRLVGARAAFGVKRIVMLGDSVTFGIHRIAATILQDLLSQNPLPSHRGGAFR